MVKTVPDATFRGRWDKSVGGRLHQAGHRCEAQTDQDHPAEGLLAEPVEDPVTDRPAQGYAEAAGGHRDHDLLAEKSGQREGAQGEHVLHGEDRLDRKSTRLNSSHYCAYRMPFSA